MVDGVRQHELNGPTGQSIAISPCGFLPAAYALHTQPELRAPGLKRYRVCLGRKTSCCCRSWHPALRVVTCSAHLWVECATVADCVPGQWEEAPPGVLVRHECPTRP